MVRPYHPPREGSMIMLSMMETAGVLSTRECSYSSQRAKTQPYAARPPERVTLPIGFSCTSGVSGLIREITHCHEKKYRDLKDLQ